MLTSTLPRIYEGDGDALMAKDNKDLGERLILVPDAFPSKHPETVPRLRILWGQHLLEDLMAGRYRSVVCAVNTQDNSHGIIAQLAQMIPTSPWDESSITHYARQFDSPGKTPRVLKFDMDLIEVLAVLRPPGKARFTLDDLGAAFRIVSEMIAHKPMRLPSASVSFLGARANALVDETGREPAFESVLHMMHDAGYTGDVYPSPDMWKATQVGLFARYPFPHALDEMRAGGY